MTVSLLSWNPQLQTSNMFSIFKVTLAGFRCPLAHVGTAKLYIAKLICFEQIWNKMWFWDSTFFKINVKMFEMKEGWNSLSAKWMPSTGWCALQNFFNIFLLLYHFKINFFFKRMWFFKMKGLSAKWMPVPTLHSNTISLIICLKRM